MREIREINGYNTAQPYNLFLRNTIKSQEVDNLLREHGKHGIRLLNIWGAKFDKIAWTITWAMFM